MNTPLSTLESVSAFSYPRKYDPQTDRAVQSHGSGHDPDERSRAFRPQDALSLWARHPYGQWQSRQVARYPSFHEQLPEVVVPGDVEPSVFRIEVLRLMASAALYQSDARAGLDFHPVGHMANVALGQDELILEGPLADMIGSPHHVDMVRHAMILHDIAETEHPSIGQRFGFHVGDIPATRGKTATERAQETRIFSALLDELFADQYSEEMRQQMVSVVSHEALHDPELREAHAVTELAHHLNTARTSIAMGITALEVALHKPRHADALSLLAEGGESFLPAKFAGIMEHIPASHPISYIIELAMGQLRAVVHARDTDDQWMSRRRALSDEYGPYVRYRHN